MRWGVFALGLLLTASVAAAQPAEPLFVHANALAAAADSAPLSGAVVSRRQVGLRIDLLFDATSRESRVLLNAEGESWIARLERVDRDAMGFRSWVGAIEGIPDSHVVFTERDGTVSGLINAVGVRYQIGTVRPGSYLLERMDISLLPDEPEPLPVAGAYETSTVTQDDATLIDVLMLYTPSARAARGGLGQIEALASQVISDTNTAFARSGIVTRVRLVGTRELALVESAQMSSDLTALKTSVAARGLRDALRADVVQLLVSSPDLSACGVAYLLASVADTAFDAYSIADIACASQYTPTHEMGHNFGAHHAPEDGASGALFSYSYGLKDPVRGFRTVMAYSCNGTPCGRIPNFSNPGVPHNGASTGTALQNNARTINEAAFTVANFRQSVAPAPTPPTAPTGLKSTVNGNAVTVSWDPVLSDSLQQQSAATSYILQAGTAAGAANLFNASVGSATSASGVLSAGTYFWRVQAVNVAGVSPPSSEAQFAVQGCAVPGAPANVGFTVQGFVVTLTWSAPAGAAQPITYLLEAGSAPGLANLLVTDVGAATSLTTTAPSGTYYVRLRSRTACGTSAPSTEQVITVP